MARFLKIRETLGWNDDPVKKDYCVYTCRNTFAHRMIAGEYNGGKGVSVETLAELMGNTPKVCWDNYAAEWAKANDNPLWDAIGGGKNKHDAA